MDLPVNLDIIIFSLGLLIIAMLGYIFRSRIIVRTFLTTAFSTIGYYYLQLRGTDNLTVYDIASLVFVCSLAGTILSYTIGKKEKRA